MRVVFGLVIVLIVIAVIAGIMLMVKRSRRGELDRKQRELSHYAPAVIRGDPLVDVVTQQGRQLNEACDIFATLMADEMNVFMPDHHRNNVRNWLTAYRERNN